MSDSAARIALLQQAMRLGEPSVHGGSTATDYIRFAIAVLEQRQQDAPRPTARDPRDDS